MDEMAVAFLNAGKEFDAPLSGAQWWARWAPPADPARKPRFDRTALEGLRRLHAAARTLVRGPDPAALGEVNAALGRTRLTLHAGSGTFDVVHAAGDPSDAVVVPVAQAIAALLSSPTLRRLRTCAGGCGTYFLDRTKNQSRRWCALSCMERARAGRRRRTA